MNSLISLGRNLNVLVTTGITGFLIYSKNNKFEKCKQMLEARKDDPFLLPSPNLKDLINETMDDMKLSDEKRARITLFLSQTPEFQHHGSTQRQSGALVGIPQYFVIDHNMSISITALMENNQFIDIQKSDPLEYSFQLSKEAKKFAIAHELYELLNTNFIYVHIFPWILNLNCIVYSYFLEKIFKNPVHKFYSRHIALFIMGVSLYALSYDTVVLYFEANADFLASNLGKSYIKGGIEYYEKMIMKNIELKKIDKNAPYSNDGDINYSTFAKHHMPIQQRISYLKDIYTAKKEKPSPWKYVLTTF